MATTGYALKDSVTGLISEGTTGNSSTASKMKSRGSCYVSTPGATTITTAGTYYVLAGTTTAGAVNDEFTHASPGRLTYTGVVTKAFTVAVTLMLQSNEASKTGVAKIYKSGSAVTGALKTFVFGPSTSDVKDFSMVFPVSLAQNEYIEIYVTMTDCTNGKTLTANTCFLTIF